MKKQNATLQEAYEARQQGLKVWDNHGYEVYIDSQGALRWYESDHIVTVSKGNLSVWTIEEKKIEITESGFDEAWRRAYDDQSNTLYLGLKKELGF